MSIDIKKLREAMARYNGVVSEFKDQLEIAKIINAYEAQQARLAEAEECIRFYADEKNHKIYVDPQGIEYPMSVVEYEKGEEAKAYLAKYCEDLSEDK